MIYQHGLFQGTVGFDLFEQSWFPEDDVKAVVLLVHGLGEHSSRYAHVAEFLTSKNIGIETFDLRGHGKSDGARAFVRSFDEYLQDVEIFYSRVLGRHPDLPLFIYGHSMGATISALYVITRNPDINGVLLSGILLKIGDDIPPILIKMSSIIGKYAPKMKTTKLDANSLSRDPKIVENYDNDPLNYRAGIPARTGLELLTAMRRIQVQMEKITLPIMIMHGSCDKITNPDGSIDLYEAVASNDKTLKMYNGFYHEIHNEPEKNRVFEDIFSWINDHLGDDQEK
ncbi:MAG: alpha/beta hydrolase [Candidatus Marinimicrobia bacterium]|nr:alpha/beta hydrolase [Candidatus Neomarinimicrobiota bacterium]